MIYETIVHERSAAHRTLANVAQVILLVGFGVLFGLILADAPDVSHGADAVKALQAGPIEGEDWHGNVRRSVPGR
ncbi:hypothetical protein KX928_11850 [Roseobacter sp. YSTF-M11]|uniref:Uncharacterized protein n=1 Tax=Roseobacter insulae TaxID=2859783 RepID=A0A9X1FVQ0_9RHOB|nr:hypothetical protein [Roseobacter insulae]MBW4708476.1 hypothetical protein [Roseobacter insulae]